MFCPHDAGTLQAVATEDLISQDMQHGNFYTHQCQTCLTYWHLHISSDNIDLISTKLSQTIASNNIRNDLKTELSKRVTQLEAMEL